MRRRVDEKLDRFIETLGREPTPQERWKLEREAAVASRPAKPPGVDAVTLHDGWADQARLLGLEPQALVTDAIGRVRDGRGFDRLGVDSMIDQALTNIAAKQSTWRPTQLHRELAAVVPTDTTIPADALSMLLDRIVDNIVETRCIDLSRPIPPDSLLRKDGRPVSESVADRALTTQSILVQEKALIGWTERRLRHHGVEHPGAADRSPHRLNVAQAQSAGAVAGQADIVLVVGPAGTGKTTALAPAVEQRAIDFGSRPEPSGLQHAAGCPSPSLASRCPCRSVAGGRARRPVVARTHF